MDVELELEDVLAACAETTAVLVLLTITVLTLVEVWM